MWAKFNNFLAGRGGLMIYAVAIVAAVVWAKCAP